MRTPAPAPVQGRCARPGALCASSKKEPPHLTKEFWGYNPPLAQRLF